MKVFKFENNTELTEVVSQFIIELARSKSQISICLSGGSTPKAIFDIWATHYSEVLPWMKLHFYWGDERCVPPSDEMSNYGMTKKHLFDKVIIPASNINRILGENDPEAEAARYANLIQTKAPIFDLVILGLGDDGHTASIFPENIDDWDCPQDCLVASHPQTGMKRVSISGKVINRAAQVAFLVTGASKADKVKQIIEQRFKYSDLYPAALVNPKNGRLFWFLDEAAAKNVVAEDKWDTI